MRRAIINGITDPDKKTREKDEKAERKMREKEARQRQKEDQKRKTNNLNAKIHNAVTPKALQPYAAAGNPFHASYQVRMASVRAQRFAFLRHLLSFSSGPASGCCPSSPATAQEI